MGHHEDTTPAESRLCAMMHAVVGRPESERTRNIATVGGLDDRRTQMCTPGGKFRAALRPFFRDRNRP